MWAGAGKIEVVFTDYCYMCKYIEECKENGDLSIMKTFEHRKWCQIFACSNKEDKEF